MTIKHSDKIDSLSLPISVAIALYRVEPQIVSYALGIYAGRCEQSHLVILSVAKNQLGCPSVRERASRLTSD